MELAIIILLFRCDRVPVETAAALESHHCYSVRLRAYAVVDRHLVRQAVLGRLWPQGWECYPWIIATDQQRWIDMATSWGVPSAECDGWWAWRVAAETLIRDLAWRGFHGHGLRELVEVWAETEIQWWKGRQR